MTTDLLAIGKISKPHGLRGGLKIEAYFQLEQILSNVSHLCLKRGKQTRSFPVKWYRQQGRFIVLKLDGIENSESAEDYRGWEIVIAAGQLPPLPGDQYYTFQLLDLEVVTVAGEMLGRIDEVLPMPAHDVFVIKRGSEKLLIPAVKAIVSEVDLSKRRVVIRNVSGLLD